MSSDDLNHPLPPGSGTDFYIGVPRIFTHGSAPGGLDDLLRESRPGGVLGSGKTATWVRMLERALEAECEARGVPLQQTDPGRCRTEYSPARRQCGPADGSEPGGSEPGGSERGGGHA